MNKFLSAVIDVPTQFTKAELGDARRTRRLVAIARCIQPKPDATFPEAMGDDAGAEGFYRFIRNKLVEWAAVFDAHASATAREIDRHKWVLAVHDTTQVHYNGEQCRKGLARTSNGQSTFYGHFCLAVTADGTRRPLGALGVLPMVRQVIDGEKCLVSGDIRFAKESAKWAELVWQVMATNEAYSHLIHVFDREGDIYDLLEPMNRLGALFIARSYHNRVLKPPKAGGPDRLDDVAIEGPVLHLRTAVLSKRTEQRPKDACLKHPPRLERIATLEVRVARVTIKRPPSASKNLPDSLTINLVRTREKNPPAGEKPVDWALYTNLPIDTEEQVAWIVENYRARWEIEDFFKALKTECALEERQLESLETLLVAMSILIPFAVRVMSMRWASRHNPDLPAENEFTGDEIAVIRARSPKMSAKPTIYETYMELARLGGFLKSNGQPGFRILARAIRKLEEMVTGYRIALGLPIQPFHCYIAEDDSIWDSGP